MPGMGHEGPSGMLVHVLVLQLGLIVEVCSLCVISLSCMVDLCVLQCVCYTSNKSLHEVKKKKAS